MAAKQYERWKLTPVADVPELAAAWADEDDPRKVMVTGGAGLPRFRCPNGHQPRIDPLRFLRSGCPHCRSARTAQAKKWLADTLPEIAAQWHPTRNGKWTPQNEVWDSKRTVWWRADCCGHEWQESVKDRDKCQLSVVRANSSAPTAVASTGFVVPGRVRSRGGATYVSRPAAG